VAVLAGAAIFTALALGFAISTWQAIRATQAEHQAITNEQQAIE